ncbi:MAG: hypothetical protein MK171_05460 [Pirellulales bacterium]|nr:hypothetical protein [Pirellulales bacterium]
MSGDATDNALKQSLSVIRDAIELYAADNLGALPPCTDPGSSFQIAVQDYIRGDFPICPVGNLNVLVRASFMDPLAADNVAAGWMYNPATGEFICNSMAATTSNPLVSYDEL